MNRPERLLGSKRLPFGGFVGRTSRWALGLVFTAPLWCADPHARFARVTVAEPGVEVEDSSGRRITAQLFVVHCGHVNVDVDAVEQRP